MKAPEPPFQGFNFKDPKQKKIHQELNRLIGDGAASFYMDACKIMDDNPPLSSKTLLITHLLREINSSVRAIMAPFNYKRTEKEGYKHQINEIAKLYEIPREDELVQFWLTLGDLNKFAHRNSLSKPREADNNLLDLWNNTQTLLSFILTRISEKYVRHIEYIDELLAKSQINASDIEKLKNHLPNNTVTLGYFFEKLQDPQCVSILKAEGFFDNPLEPLLLPEGGVRYPYWPQSAYLIRMAKVGSTQKEILEICLDIETENVTIQADILEVAASLPVDMSLKLLEKAKPWIKDRGLWILSEKYGQLISHLTKEGKADEAIDLARSVLKIIPDPKYSQRGGDDSAYILPPNPTAYFDDNEYQEILRAVMPDLVKGSREKAIDMEAQLLDDAITFSLREPNKPTDYSYIWQPAIENHSQNLIHGLKAIILINLRDTCEFLLKEDPAQLNGVIQILEKHEWEVFIVLSFIYYESSQQGQRRK